MKKIKYYSNCAICFVLFIYLLISYNGLWNLALYFEESTYDSFIPYCLMVTPASFIAASLGALSILEIICTITDKRWKALAQMLLWALLTLLLNSYTLYLISRGLGHGLNFEIWVFFAETTITNVIWYFLLLYLLKRSVYWNKIIRNMEREKPLSKVETDKGSSQNLNNNQGTTILARNLLSKIGCSPINTEEGRIHFNYQSINFIMEAADDCLFVNLIWPWCYRFSKFDIDEFARVRRVVNDINMQGLVSVFYNDTDSDDVVVHLSKHFLLASQIPNIEDYMKFVFELFFRTTHTLNVKIKIEEEKCRMQENE